MSVQYIFSIAAVAHIFIYISLVGLKMGPPKRQSLLSSLDKDDLPCRLCSTLLSDHPKSPSTMYYHMIQYDTISIQYDTIWYRIDRWTPINTPIKPTHGRYVLGSNHHEYQASGSPNRWAGCRPLPGARTATATTTTTTTTTTTPTPTPTATAATATATCTMYHVLFSWQTNKLLVSPCNLHQNQLQRFGIKDGILGKMMMNHWIWSFQVRPRKQLARKTNLISGTIRLWDHICRTRLFPDNECNRPETRNL